MNLPWPLLASVLVASFMGSLHCAAMCGPLVLVYSGSSGAGEATASRWSRLTGTLSRRPSLTHATYHGVRGLMYTGLGAISGGLGGGVDDLFAHAGFFRGAAIVSGALVILWGLGAWLPASGRLSPLHGPMKKALVQLGKKPRATRAGWLGMLTPLLPCGWLYAFVLTAAGTGSAVTGAVLMLTFFLGTVPALLGVGVVSGRAASLLRPRLPVLTSALLVSIGLLGVVTRSRVQLPPATGNSALGESAASGDHGHSCH